MSSLVKITAIVLCNYMYIDLIVHLSTIFRLGPLVGSWCMRYEAKHHYFKHLAIVVGNFINLPFTLAKRHQEAVAYRLKSAEGNLSSFIHKGVEIGPGKAQSVKLLSVVGKQ